MPLGNSITVGYTDGSLPNEQLKGYRYGLRYLLKNYGYTLDFVGSQTGGSAFFNDCQHAGIEGTRDQYLVSLLTTGYDERNGVQILIPPRLYLDDYNPDIILLHIGTNDITHEGTAALTNQKVSDILDLIDQYEARAGKEVIVFLALIINRVKPWSPGSPAAITTTFNNGIKAMAQTRIASGDKIVIVDMENDAGFEYTTLTDMAPDGVHPNDAGYSKMAGLWFTSITANYNTPPFIQNIPDQSFAEGGSSTALSLDNYVEDTEDEDDQITWSAVQQGTSNLNITINANRQVSATPKDMNWSGSQTVVFTATDLGRNGKYIKSDRDTVIFTVNPVNDVPVITSTPVLDAEVGKIYSYTFTATDIDNPSISLSALSKPSWLSFSQTTGLLSGTPSAANQGQNLVTLRASDGSLHADQSFTITVDNADAIFDTESHTIKIFPVPAKDYLEIEPGIIHEDALIEVFNASGITYRKLVLSAGQQNYQLDVSHLENGIYYLHITDRSNCFMGKFLIIR